jgi:uncharacterized surface protein with fasciclin (FAS1) repeats
MTPMRSVRRTLAPMCRNRRVVAVVAVVAIALAACGDDDDDTESAGGAVSTAEVATSGTSEETTATTAAASSTTTIASTTTSAATESTPPAAHGPLCEAAGVEDAEGFGDMTVAEAIAGIATLSTFASLVSASGTATSRLEGKRAITVFAPVDEAFETAGIDADALTADPAQLDSIVLQHIVSGLQTSEALGVTESLQNVAGAPLTFAAQDDTVMVNGTATVGCADIQASNGVIHLVDAVLQPPSPEATTPTTAAG